MQILIGEATRIVFSIFAGFGLRLNSRSVLTLKIEYLDCSDGNCPDQNHFEPPL